MTDPEAAAGAALLLLALILVELLFVAAWYVWTGLSFSRLFRRMSAEPWRGWVPVLNTAEVLALGGVSRWWVLLFAVPIANLYALFLYIVAANRVGRLFGKGAGMTVLAVLVPPLWATLLGWGKVAPDLEHGRFPSAPAPARVSTATGPLATVAQPGAPIGGAPAAWPADPYTPFGAPAAPGQYGAPAAPAQYGVPSPAASYEPVAPALPEPSVAPGPPPASVVDQAAPNPWAPVDAQHVVPPSAPYSPAAYGAPVEPAGYGAPAPADPAAYGAPAPADPYGYAAPAAPADPYGQAAPADPAAYAAPAPADPTAYAAPAAPAAYPAPAQHTEPYPQTAPAPAPAPAEPLPGSGSLPGSGMIVPPAGIIGADAGGTGHPPAAPAQPAWSTPQTDAGSAPAAAWSAPAVPVDEVDGATVLRLDDAALDEARRQAPADPEPYADDDYEATVVVDRRPKVAWRLRLDDGSELALTGDRVLLGRNPADAATGEQRLAVPDSTRTLSKTHARLELVAGQWVITDLGSTNGVLIDVGGEEQLIDAGVATPVPGRFVLGKLGMQIVAGTP
ncbi:DUF5684 domain-containing protein [Agromyces larvae]|uniref:DUF5684 domain-containing protein n=1 Tax=Agromyces larvae TaxID=2929802 RepID=A0ABY4BXL6_9MICO|nr:DUF5684 domain-containing protein [Agromyces larvae]UOE43962.1 DUF5684 domain-containing protein [Agromyces larvae]